MNAALLVSIELAGLEVSVCMH